MYYRFKASGFGSYDFVYDDRDKSVELVNLIDLCNCGIVLQEQILSCGTMKSGDTDWNRLISLGFHHMKALHRLSYDICSWFAGDSLCNMYVYVEDDCDIYVCVDFNRVVTLAEYVKKYVHMFQYYRSINTVSIDIPFAMLKYILHIKSEHDFDKLMSCFGGFFWGRIGDLVNEIRAEELHGVDWDRLSDYVL